MDDNKKEDDSNIVQDDSKQEVNILQNEIRINKIIDLSVMKAMDKLIDNMKDTYESKVIENSNIKMKSESLIMIDMLYCIFPEMKIFGETVRDLLVNESDININILLVRLSEADFTKKIDKMRKQLEIYGYLLSINNINDYNLGWKLFRDNYLTYGVSNGIISRIGSNNKKVKILIVSTEKMSDFNPLFKCDMLMMDNNGMLSMRKNIISELDDERCMMNIKIKWMKTIMNDINNKKITLIEPIKIKNGYADRLYRSKIMYHSIKIMEKGWQPVDNILKNCGFNMNLYKLKKSNVETLNFPDYNTILNNTNDNKTDILSDSSERDETCSICRESLDKLSIVITNCGHYFHNICIFQHMHKIGYNSTICPICRKEIVHENQESIVLQNNQSNDSDSFDDDDEINDNLNNSNDEEDDDLEETNTFVNNAEIINDYEQILAIAQL